MNNFERLNSELFNEKIEKAEMSQVLGGEAYGVITRQVTSTYVTINTDTVECGEDYRGKSCGPVRDIILG